jgi:DnaJ-class molecular chaperone
MADKDYYTVLGVSQTSTPDEIKKAYRKLALDFHPDRNKSKEADAKFKEITKAYEVLSSDDKRKMYDQVGHSAFEQGAGGGQGSYGGAQGGQYGPFTYSTNGGGFDFDFGGSSDPFEIFEQFFGGASPFGQQRKRRAVYQATISFMEAAKGVEREVSIDGKRQKIKIPAGVNKGSRIRFENYDIVIDVTPDSRFARQDFDVISEKEISFPQAALGGEITVATVDGDLKIRIPEGTQPEALVRLNRHGIQHLRGSGRGNHYVRIKVIVPKKLSKHQKELLQDFQKEEGKPSWF